MIYSKLLTTGGYLPEKVLTNYDIAKMVETSHEWIVERSGIHQRHIAASHETVASMGEIAAREAMQSANVSPSEIQLILVATSTSQDIFPSTACMIQKNLNIGSQCFAFDLNAACSGFMYALSVADQYIRQGMVSKALIIGSEIMSRTLDWTDRSTCILFGDGAGAVLLEKSNTPGIHSTILHSNGAEGEALTLIQPKLAGDNCEMPMAVKMVGSKVFKVAVETLEQVVLELLSRHQVGADTIDWLVPHQANIRILKATAKKLGLPMERVICTLDKQANTTAATIPLALHHGITNGKIKRGERLLLESFGAGFTWGAALIDY